MDKIISYLKNYDPDSNKSFEKYNYVKYSDEDDIDSVFERS